MISSSFSSFPADVFQGFDSFLFYALVRECRRCVVAFSQIEFFQIYGNDPDPDRRRHKQRRGDTKEASGRDGMEKGEDRE